MIFNIGRKDIEISIPSAERCPLEYMQFPTEIKTSLRSSNVKNIEDLISFVKVSDCSNSELRTALNALYTLESVSSAIECDWYAYWRARGFEFHDLHLTCKELETFDRNNQVCAVDKDIFGNAGMVLARSGYTTLMDLAKLNKKAFFIPTPGQFEQQYLAKRLMAHHIAPYCQQRHFKVEQLKKIAFCSGLNRLVLGARLWFMWFSGLFDGK